MKALYKMKEIHEEKYFDFNTKPNTNLLILMIYCCSILKFR